MVLSPSSRLKFPLDQSFEATTGTCVTDRDDDDSATSHESSFVRVEGVEKYKIQVEIYSAIMIQCKIANDIGSFNVVGI